MPVHQKHEHHREVMNARVGGGFVVAITGRLTVHANGPTEALAHKRAEDIYRERLYEGTEFTEEAEVARVAPLLYAYHASLSAGMVHTILPMPESQRPIWEARARGLMQIRDMAEEGGHDPAEAPPQHRARV